MLTYGDGLSNVNLRKLVNFHKKNKKIATLTAVRPPARFGAIRIKGNKIKYFKEKSKLDVGWINGGFFVFNRKIFNYIKGDGTYLEREPLQRISKKGELLCIFLSKLKCMLKMKINWFITGIHQFQTIMLRFILNVPYC